MNCAACHGRLLATVVLVVAMLCGCVTRSETSGGPQVPLTTPNEDVISGGVDIDELNAQLRDAVSRDDLCSFVALFDQGAPLSDVGEPVVEFYKNLSNGAETFSQSVPAQIADDWPLILETLKAGSAAVEAVGGDIFRSGVASTFDSPDFQRAVVVLQRWRLNECV